MCGRRINWENMRLDGLSPPTSATQNRSADNIRLYTWLVCYDNCSLPVIIVFSMKIIRVAIDIFIYQRPTQFGVGTHRPKRSSPKQRHPSTKWTGERCRCQIIWSPASSSTAPEPAHSAHAPHFYLVSTLSLSALRISLGDNTFHIIRFFTMRHIANNNSSPHFTDD